MRSKLTHYFTDNSNLKENRKEHSFRFSGTLYTFITDNGVFSKTGVDYGTQVLLESLAKEHIFGKIMDLGCGYGVIGIVAKTLFPQAQVTCVDVNPRAVELTEDNSVLNKVSLNVICSDGFAQIDDTYDAIITNPPIRTGKKVIYSLFEEAYRHLNQNGILLMVIRKQQGAPSAVKKLEEIFNHCEIVDRQAGYWILRCRKMSDTIDTLNV